MRSRDRHWIAALMVAAAAVRFATIDVQSFWFDEALTAHLLRMPLGDMLSKLPDTELTPPLYYVVAWPWAHVVGSGELALRSLSALFGIATVPVVWLAGRELASARAALIAGALVAFNPLLVWYSQEARPYSLLVLLSGLSFLFFARAIERRADRELAWWALWSILALLTHYFAAFLAVPEALWLAWIWRPRSRALIAGAAVAAVGAALVPLARHESAHVSAGYIQSLSLRRRLLAVPEDFLTGFVIKWDTAREKLLDAIALAAAGLGVWLAFARTEGRERQGAVVAAALALCAAGIPALMALAGIDYLNTRNVLAGVPPALVLLAIGFAAAPTGVRAASVAGLCAVGVAATAITAADDTFHRADWRGAAHALGSSGGARVIVAPPLAQVDLEPYVDRLAPLPARGAVVSEVDVLTPRNPRLGGGRVARPVHPVAPGAGFGLAERRYDGQYTVIRWTSATPRQVSAAGAARTATGVTVPSPLLQAGER